MKQKRRERCPTGNTPQSQSVDYLLLAADDSRWERRHSTLRSLVKKRQPLEITVCFSCVWRTIQALHGTLTNSCHPGQSTTVQSAGSREFLDVCLVTIRLLARAPNRACCGCTCKSWFDFSSCLLLNVGSRSTGLPCLLRGACLRYCCTDLPSFGSSLRRSRLSSWLSVCYARRRCTSDPISARAVVFGEKGVLAGAEGDAKDCRNYRYVKSVLRRHYEGQALCGHVNRR